MTPPAAAAAAPARRRTRASAAAAPARPLTTAPRPRRVSGPARPAVRPSPARQPARPAARPGRSAARREDGLVVGLLNALRSLSRHRLLDRLIVGRSWIGLVAFALIGIVTLQLLLLKLNTSIGRSLEREALLQNQISALSIENSELAAGNRVEASATGLGMELVPVGALRFLTAGSRGDATRAAGALRTPVQASAVESSEAASSSSATGEEASTEAGASEQSAGATSAQPASEASAGQSGEARSTGSEETAASASTPTTSSPTTQSSPTEGASEAMAGGGTPAGAGE